MVSCTLQIRYHIWLRTDIEYYEDVDAVVLNQVLLGVVMGMCYMVEELKAFSNDGSNTMESYTGAGRAVSFIMDGMKARN
jgi:hypothetical protein